MIGPFIKSHFCEHRSAVPTCDNSEDYPRGSNDTDEGRQQNRRVVITVKPAEGTSDIDYELEDG